MELSDILKPEAVKAIAKTASKKRILQEMADRAGTLYAIDASEGFQALLDREGLGPTGVGEGVAIPHARLAGLEEVVGVFYKLKKPLDYDAVDRQPVDLIFALFAPVDSGVEHLKALALISRVLRDPATRSKLRSNSNPATVYAILTEVAASKAA